MAITVDLRQNTLLSYERVACHRLALGGDVHNLAMGCFQLLCVVSCCQVGSFTGAYKEISLLVEQQAATKMHAVVEVGDGTVDDAELFNGCLIVRETSLSYRRERSLRGTFCQ